MNAKEKKERKKEHYVEVISKKEPVHPAELGFKDVRYDYLDELEAEGRIGRIKHIPKDSKRKTSGYTLLFMPGREYLAEERFNSETGRIAARQKQKQEPQLDFRPDINEWYNQLSYWDEFFTPWVHSKEILFDRRLPIEYEPTYPLFKKFVEKQLKENPDLCLNPFDEQDKLKRKMKEFNELRDKILDEFKDIIEKKMPDIKKKLPNFNENFKQSLLQILYMRKTYEFLKRQEFDKKFSVTIETIRNKFHISKNRESNIAVEEVLEILSEEIDKSQVITEKLIVELWTMISESQMICTRIMRALKVLGRIK